jgi:molybdopterin biosynthesis enzyme MoaB
VAYFQKLGNVDGAPIALGSVKVVPDEPAEIAAAVKAFADDLHHEDGKQHAAPHLIVTMGGTGFSVRPLCSRARSRSFACLNVAAASRRYA